jgi:glyoxylase-like metal-dependent hydrolase (beta-lactamase superfamily II)
MEHKTQRTLTIEYIVVGSLETNCWLYPLEDDPPEGENKAPRPCAVIDPGADADCIIARMEQLKLYPRYVLLTHGHYDHLAGLPDIKAYRDDIDIAIHRDDAQYLGPDSLPYHRKSFIQAAGSAGYVDACWTKPMPSPTILLADDDYIGPFRVIHLPGHSPGSVAFYRDGTIFSGDTLFKDGEGRTDLPGGDPVQMQQSLVRLLTLDGVVYPGHGPVTTIHDEARYWDDGINV